jgi:riboflavin synthase
MFTGLVEGLGTIAEILPDGPAKRLVVEAPLPLLAGTSLGDSVALNGCCLTVVAIHDRCWSFEAGPETLARTNLDLLRAGDRVNLERALRADARIGGHFVQGHVDGCGAVERLSREGDWVTMWFRVAASLAHQMVSKGSVAVDGVSLTLVDVEAERFSVALIPHTLGVTTLGSRREHDRVNIETDILAKYVERLLAPERL